MDISGAHRYDLAYYLAVDPDAMPRQIECLASLGVSRLGTDGFCKWRDEAFTSRIASIFKAGGLRPYSFHSPLGVMFPDASKARLHIDDAKRLVDVAQSWGAESMVWHFRWLRSYDGDTHFAPFSAMDARTPQELDSLMALPLPEICAYAAQAGITVNMENMPLFAWSKDCRDIFSFIKSMAIPNLGFIFDIGHAWCSGYDPAAIIREAGKLLNDTHFHDNLGVRRPLQSSAIDQRDIHERDLHLPPGLGTVNWIETVAALREASYSHPLVFEGPNLRFKPGSCDPFESFRRAASISICNWRAFEDLERNLAQRHD